MPQNYHMYLVFIQKKLTQVGVQKNLKKSLIIFKYHGQTFLKQMIQVLEISHGATIMIRSN